jgi:tetratricopeptide (TPR) repeat protein
MDEGAITEYATAVHLDPTNQDALRSYADYLLLHRDYRGAIPVLKRLVRLAKKPDDIKNLMKAFLGAGEAHEALDTHALLGGDTPPIHEYVDALIKTGNYQKAAESAQTIYRETKNPAVLQKYLEALSRYNVPASLDEYAAHIRDQPDCALLFDYILLLKASGKYREALDATQVLISFHRRPLYLLAGCDILADLGERSKALAGYEQLIRDELKTKNDLDTLGLIISRYRKYLTAQVPAVEAKRRFAECVSKDVNVASLLETARFFEDLDDEAEARSWYYRAYRADFFLGGLEYAKFLSAHNEDRECEKVMLYILANVKKGADLTRVAAVIVERGGRMYRLKRLMDQLIRRLEEKRGGLHSEGLELLAMAFFIAATSALEETDYAGCKYFCLCGMDVMPAHARVIRLEDFLSLVRACKEQSVADRPIMNAQKTKKRPVAAQQSQAVTDQLGLSPPEQQIVGFLRSHRTASEMDLRRLLGTRRVVGMVNRIIAKAAAQGISILEKKGVGEDGEVYEYTGT